MSTSVQQTVRAEETHGSAALLPDQNQDASDQGENRKQNAGSAEGYSENADDAGEDQVDGEHEHADVFGYHEAILTQRRRLSRANLCDSLPIRFPVSQSAIVFIHPWYPRSPRRSPIRNS
jgi:hypothetical protein